MRPLLHASVLTATLALAACAATPSTSSDGSRRFSGTVQAVDNGCFVDGVCTATVDGIVVTTMSGERLNNPVWGEPNALPEVGQRVDVHCLSTGATTCTLKGSRDYYLRPSP